MTKVFQPTWSAVWKYLTGLPPDIKAEINILFDFYVPGVGGDLVFEDESFNQLSGAFEELSESERENFLTLFSFLNIVQID